MNTGSLQAERAHLAKLLEAMQRCGYFLDAASTKHYLHDLAMSSVLPRTEFAATSLNTKLADVVVNEF